MRSKSPCDYILGAVDDSKSDQENNAAICACIKELIETATPEELSEWWGGLQFDFERKTAVATLVFPSQRL